MSIPTENDETQSNKCLNATTPTLALKNAITPIVYNVNPPREFPPKENTSKTELTRLNCVRYLMHAGCPVLVQSTVYLDRDLNTHNG